MAFLDWLKALDIVIAAIVVPVIGLIVWAFSLWERRLRASQDSRLQNVEDRLDHNADRLDVRLERVESDLTNLTDEMKSLQRSVDRMPDADKLTALQVHTASLSAKVDQIEGMVKTIYTASLRAAERQ
ncbi:MAG: hypothetical protein ACU0CO_10265 [Shimia sp.]